MLILNGAISAAFYVAHFIAHVGISLKRAGPVILLAGRRAHYEDIWFTAREANALDEQDAYLPLIVVDDSDRHAEPMDTDAPFERMLEEMDRELAKLRAEGVEPVPRLSDAAKSL